MIACAPRAANSLSSTGSLRVLFIAPYVPSLIRVRPLHLLRGLAACGHAVTLICPVRSPDDARDLDAMRSHCARVVGVPVSRLAPLARYVRALPGPYPFQVAHALDDQLVAAVAGAFADHDIAHVEHLRGSLVALAARKLAGRGPPLVLDSVDCISLLFERTVRESSSLGARCVALADLARTRRYEMTYGQGFEQVLVTSAEDRWALEVLGTSAVSVVPNGVDTDYFRPQGLQRERATIILTGKMSYHANHSAALFLAREIMPLVWRERRDARVLIVGADPAPALRSLAADSRVTVTGRVPDVRPYLARATLAACPLRYGVGVQNKVLEAMAMGAAVVTVPQATRALSARPDHELLVGASAAEFARRILELLADPDRCNTLGANGRGYVERHHQWAESARRLEEIYFDVLKLDTPLHTMPTTTTAGRDTRPC